MSSEQTNYPGTVKPVFKGHCNILEKVSPLHRCPFIAGSFDLWKDREHHSEKMSSDHRVSPCRSVPWRQVLRCTGAVYWRRFPWTLRSMGDWESLMDASGGALNVIRRGLGTSAVALFTVCNTTTSAPLSPCYWFTGELGVLWEYKFITGNMRVSHQMSLVGLVINLVGQTHF